MQDKNLMLGVLAIIVTLVLGFWGMNASFNTRFDAMNMRIDATRAELIGRIDKVETRLDARIGELSAKIDRVIDRQIDTDRRLAALEEK